MAEVFCMQVGSSRRIGGGGVSNDDTFITIASKYGFDGERQKERMEKRAQKLRDSDHTSHILYSSTCPSSN